MSLPIPPAATLLNIFYTAHLEANFSLMPRLFSTIQQQRHQLSPPTLLLDIGQVWSAEDWICQATENRAPYLVLDAMGYNAVLADGLDQAGILGLQEAVQLKLLGKNTIFKWHWRDLWLNIGSHAELPKISFAAPDQTPPASKFFITEPQHLTLFPPRNEIIWLQVDWPHLNVIDFQSIPFDNDARPDPTIMGAIEFVENEARYYAQRKKGPTTA